ncbi:hypothetical protein Ciccas_014480 [Cichlidogyrus casuarinus]|uniref:Uncharacterized protein n=1 Tax=Cichlidogyrus casuarinus TaxID=1844966 RepID=A0ABD2PI59_9PLAT
MADQPDISVSATRLEAQLLRRKVITRCLNIEQFDPEYALDWLTDIKVAIAGAEISSEATMFSLAWSTIPKKHREPFEPLVESVQQNQTTTPFKDLEALIKTKFAPDEEEKIRKLLVGLSLGNRKPSELHASIASKAKEFKLPDTMGHQLFGGPADGGKEFGRRLRWRSPPQTART